MSVPQPPNISYHPYSHALQIRVYQAFIFSIPILFSIILFLLFYLFYLKRRAYALSSSPPPLPPSSFTYATPYLPMPHVIGFKGDLKDKLPKVVFNEDLKAKDSICCVCLGEFEIKEELIQVPSCKHVFHKDCIHHWLQSNSSCPLCRCCVFLAVGPLSHPTGPLRFQPNIQEAHMSGDGPTTEGTSTTTIAEATTTTNLAANSDPRDCLTVSSTSHDSNDDVSSELSVVIHVQTQ